jgi:hypothetical protein
LEEHIAYIFRVKDMASSLLGLFFNSEDGSSMLPQTSVHLLGYTVSAQKGAAVQRCMHTFSVAVEKNFMILFR